MARTARDGNLKISILTTEPADPAAPTDTELEAGIDASDVVAMSDLAWGATDSDTISERAVGDRGNMTNPGASNYGLGMTFFRSHDGSVPDAADDAYQAVKTKGTEVWVYVRETDEFADAPWAATNEIYLGGRVKTDTPTRVGTDGNIKMRVPMHPQKMYDDIVVAGP
ncbi:hypothetical protein BJH93_04145 [Kocuria polaris]|nr:hypothetical protein [Kocuria polaris]